MSPHALAAKKTRKRRTAIANNIRSIFKIPNAGKSSSDDASDASLNPNDFSDLDNSSSNNSDDKPKRRSSDTALLYEAQATGLITEPQDKPARVSGGIIGKLFKSKKKQAGQAEAEDRPKRRASESELGVKAKNESSDTEGKSNEKIPKSRGSGSSASLRVERKLGKETDDGPIEKGSKSRGSGSSASLRVERKLGKEIDDGAIEKGSKSRGSGSSASLRGERKLGEENDGSNEKSSKSRGSGTSVGLRGERKLGKETINSSAVASDKTKKKSRDIDDKPKRRGSAGALTYKGSRETRSERGADDSSTSGAPKPKRNAGMGKDDSLRSIRSAGASKPKKKRTLVSSSAKSSKDGDNTTTTKKKMSSRSSGRSRILSDSVSSKDAKNNMLKTTTSDSSASSRESKSENSERSPKSPGALSSKGPGKRNVKSLRAERKIGDESEKKTRGNSVGRINKDKFRKKKLKQERRRSVGNNDALNNGLAVSMPATTTSGGTLGNSLATLSLNDADPSSSTQQRVFAGDAPIAAENDGFTSISKTIKASSMSVNRAKEDSADAVAKPDFTKRTPLRRRSSLSSMALTRPDLMQKPVRRSSFGDEEDIQVKEEEVSESTLRTENQQNRGRQTSTKFTNKHVAFTEDETGSRWNTQIAERSDAEPVRQLRRALSTKEKEVLKEDLLFNKLEVVRLRQSLSDALDKAIKYSESHRQERKEFAKSTTELLQLKMEHQKTVEERRRLKTDLDFYKESLDQKDEKIDSLTGAVDSQLDKVEILEEELEHAEDDLFKMEDQIREFEEAFPGIIEGGPAKARISMRNIADDMERKLEENTRHRRLEERQEILDLKEQELESKERELRLATEKDGARRQGEVEDRALQDDRVNNMLKELSDANKSLIKDLVEEKEKASAQLRRNDRAQDTLLREIDIMKDKCQVIQTQVDSNAEEHHLVIKGSNKKLQGLIDENSELMEKLERQKEHSESEDDVEEQLKEKDTEISDLNTDIEDLQEELTKLKKEKKKGATEGGSDLVRKLSSLKKANLSLKEQLEAEQDKSTNSLQDESDVIATLKTKLSRQQLDLESSKSVNAKILESESRLKDKLATSQALRDSESDRMQEAIDKLLLEKKTLEEEMKDGRTRTAVSLKTKDDTIAELQAQITGLKGAMNYNSSATIELESQKSRFESLQVELNTAKARNTLLEGGMEELQAAKRELQSKSLTFTGEQKADLETLKAEVDEWKSKTSYLQGKMEDSASQVADWKRRAQEWEKEAAEWESVATGAQHGLTSTAPSQSAYLSAASTGKKKEEPGKWGGLSNMFSRHSDHPRNASNSKLDEDEERVEMLETQNSALKETLTKLQSQLAEKNGEE